MKGEDVKPMNKMKGDRKLMIRVSEEQYALFQNKKEAAGYRTLSQFIRDKILNDSLATEKMLAEIHKAVVK